MTLRDLEIKSSYETLQEDPVAGFYVPVLGEAVSYDRIAGFFSSTSLALAARGILGLIKNGGKMRLIVSPYMSEDDAEAIRQATIDPVGVIEASMISSLEDLSETLEYEHVKALGWMMANGLLEMRIACVDNEGLDGTGSLFHQKVGVVTDAEGNALSFSGSINETASGWLSNVEEFKVFRSWQEGEASFFESDVSKFADFWFGRREYVKILTPSEAFCERFVKLGERFDRDKLTLSSYLRERRIEEAKGDIPLFFYQNEAVEAWRNNGYRLLFEMATGTGKTRTAIACMNLLPAAQSPLVCVVSAPEVTLAHQWESEIEKLGVRFDEVIYADSSHGGRAMWEKQLGRCLSALAVGRRRWALVLTTHDTVSSPAFIDKLRGAPKGIEVCFVGDEVHGLGAPKRQQGLLDTYRYRIGLSATPQRWFDDAGSRLLEEYFGGTSYRFSVKDAQETINPITGETFLTPFVYRLYFLSLDDEEMDSYIALSEKIVKFSFSDDQDVVEQRDRLVLRRANIVKNAAAKLPMFERLVKHEDIENTLVFASPQQIDEVCRILARNGVSAHPFTQNQGTRSSKDYGGLSERQHLIRCFKEGLYQALVAISCLDEGIDIPSAQKAFLLSSSTNPREYIQRIGRVIRRYPGKERAEIVDFIVEPSWARINDAEVMSHERRMFEKELRRVEDMASVAVNSTEVLFEIRERLGRLYGV